MTNDDDLEKRAKSGDIKALKALATLYEIGIDRPADPKKAFQLWLRVAKSGDPVAQVTVSTMLDEGEGTDKDPEQAEYWRRQAEKQNVFQWDKAPTNMALPTGKKILIIDDDNSMTNFIAKMCKEQGALTLCADSAESAFKEIAQHPNIDLVLLDLVMPKISGIQFLKSVRRMKILEGIPVIAISGNFVAKSIQILKSLGVNDFIAKPITKEILADKLDSVFN